jgi:AcrR family transcriptional regulator
MRKADTTDPVRQNILEEALVEFARYGFEGTRIEAITGRTHTSKRMIYYHFGSKQGLYAAVLGYAYQLVRDPADEARLQPLAPMDALVAMVHNAFDVFCRYPDFIRLSLQENLHGANVLKTLPEVARINRNGLKTLKRVLSQGQAQGVMRSDISATDVYINFVGLCSYHISARNTYKATLNIDFATPARQRSRRDAISDMLVRYVKA